MNKFHPLPAALLSAAILATMAPAALAQEEFGESKVKHASLLGPRKFQQTDGEALYKNVCQACHMANAQGAAGAAAFPALAKNPKLEAASYPVWMVVNGNKAMPSFKNQMSDEQIAAVVAYVRSHFGNSYGDSLSADQVKAVRDAGK